MAAVREARATWRGDLFNGEGEVSSVTSEHLRGLPVSWASRTEEAAGRTSPEELLAAAHASCFAMAFSNGLAKAGHPAEQLDVRAAVTFDKTDVGFRVTHSRLSVSGRVPGIEAAAFTDAAEAAKEGCPISQALHGNVELSVEATLEG